MLVSYRWLQDYVDIPWEPEELAERLTMAGLEVEGITPLAPALDRVYVGLVTDARQHPRADNLKVCSVDLGDLGVYTIVCGAPNVREGQKVAAALEGAVLPGGVEIKSTEIRGVQSEGMICSQAELGISDDHSGIWVLPEHLAPGQLLVEAVGLDDVILDVSVYANRPDCMSVIGIAREIAALTGGELRLPSLDYQELDTPITERTSVIVEDKERCPRYTAALLDGVRIGESPLWMQLRLWAAGMRPINNVVDITNYVMLETGQPLHAFDYHKLAEGRLVIRTARQGEEIVTLDGERRTLGSDMLVICDAHTPKCVAGIMGGEDSEVTDQTETILLESANFSPVNIRRTSRALGLSSESSSRFEKGIDPNGAILASKRALHLLQTLAGARIYSGHIDIDASSQKDTVVELELSEVERLLGVPVPRAAVCRILRSLEFGVEELSQELLRVTVPSYRGDVELAADLVEEVVRIWGLENLPSTLPPDRASSGGQSEQLAMIGRVREALVGAGLQEALSYSFGRPDSNRRLRRGEEFMLRLQNPISEDLAVMRISLLPGLLEAVSLNASRQQTRVALFEVGAVYLGEPPLAEQPTEELRLGVALWGRRNDPNWALGDEEFDFYDLKGILEMLLPWSELEWSKGQDPSFHPGRQMSLNYQGQEVGVFGEIHPQVLRSYKIPGRVYAAELRIAEVLPLFKKIPEFRALPRFPAVDRDLAVVVDADQPVGEMLEALEDLAGELLQEVAVFDVYAGKPIPEGRKSVAFAFRFQGERTLTDEEINAIMDRCREGLRQRFGAELR
ncbi:MAG: phenylalanine--tRNA ligase subunit beta [Limnochordia bacterium]|jgi:phenylalanyl-tRNA synthetase beta chain|nr:phenylalanine--tRNA ligase subunit beta [Bacillota bacterium]NLL08703.1 phenylalanine--tRNA ligase subunit beta [Bacillota bacterium]HBG08455.1 phenylalanine--tRNA ligase subunit beta [Bacillota bacterium]